MRILITGNLGYLGPELVRYIRKKDKNIEIIGVDTGFFAHSLSSFTFSPDVLLDKQIYIDIRNINNEIFKNVDAVIHLCAISNDPMGNKYEVHTSDINYKSSLVCAEMAALNGVKNFVFASSCSVYGEASDMARNEADLVNPLTAYAKSKINTENGLKEQKYQNMTITNLRFATACGASSRLRLDLVLNEFVYSAIHLKKIVILSDGMPWRPLIDVEDMAKALFWAANRDNKSGGNYLTVNTGANENNFKIKDLANLVSQRLGGIEVEINKDAMPDKRSYKVDFSQYESLIDGQFHNKSINQTIDELSSLISKIEPSKINDINVKYKRLATLENHILENRLNNELFWN